MTLRIRSKTPEGRRLAGVRLTRRVVPLIGAVLVVGALFAPAEGHVTRDFAHLWNRHIKPKFAGDGTINQSSDPVHWTKLKGVPQAFADGLDNVGGTASDLDCAGCVGTDDVAAGAVTEANLGFDATTQAELDNHKMSLDHDGRYFTKQQLSEPGTINSLSNPLHWTKLLGVPSGFADGIDQDSGGDITSVTAGTGLTGGGLSGAVTLGVNTSVVQARVSGTCPTGSAIRTIASDGSVTCQSDSGLTGWHSVRGTTASDGTDFKSLTVKCPTGEIATGGGARIGGVSNLDSGIPVIFGSGPVHSPPNGWQANATSKWTGGPASWNLIIDVVCVRPF